MTESLKILMVDSGTTWVLWLLIALSVGSLAVVIERGLAFWRHRDDVETLVWELHRLLGDGDVDGARKRLVRSPSAAAKIALAGLAQWEHGSRPVQEAMAAASGLEKSLMQRRLMFLGTVGNNAPFVGLLGTVIGVVGAFEELGRAQLGGAAASGLAPERVMSTIAEALVATAIGLVVAIPAVAVFNYFQGRCAASLASAETLGHVLLTHIGRAR
jgi:biopolymer transport protein ExbB